VATARARREQRERARQGKVRERESEARIARYWKGLTPEERERLDAEALAGAAPGDRAAYEAAAAPVRRLLLVGLRDALIRHRLGLPAVD
jgi:hypothetical protein